MFNLIKKSYAILGWKIVKYTGKGRVCRVCCPICRSSIEKIATNARFTILRCTCCGHATTSFQLEQEELAVLYEGIGYWRKDKGHQGIVSFLEGNWETFLNPRLESIYEQARFSDDSTKNVLEIGCSEGRLLYELKNRGHKVLGFETNKTLAERGSTTFSLPIVSEGFSACKVDGEKFDLVLAYHTIEHISDVVAIVSDLRSVTADNGILVAELPIETIYTNPDHVHFFTEKSAEM